MKYLTFQQAQTQLRDGDIVFIKGKWSSLTQALIMIATQSTLTHCAIAFTAHIGSKPYTLVVEAQGGNKRRIVALDMYRDHDVVIIPAPLPWEQVQDNALKEVGIERYGWIQAIYVGLRDACRKYFNISLPVKDFPAEICSEFVARIYGIKNPDVSPQDLYMMLKKGA